MTCLGKGWDRADGDSVDYIADAAYQGLAYYTMSAMSNDPFKLARMAGYYKGVQSAGAAVSFGMDAVKVGPPPSQNTCKQKS